MCILGFVRFPNYLTSNVTLLIFISFITPFPLSNLALILNQSFSQIDGANHNLSPQPVLLFSYDLSKNPTEWPALVPIV